MEKDIAADSSLKGVPSVSIHTPLDSVKGTPSVSIDIPLDLPLPSGTPSAILSVSRSESGAQMPTPPSGSSSSLQVVSRTGSSSSRNGSSR